MLHRLTWPFFFPWFHSWAQCSNFYCPLIYGTKGTNSLVPHYCMPGSQTKYVCVRGKDKYCQFSSVLIGGLAKLSSINFLLLLGPLKRAAEHNELLNKNACLDLCFCDTLSLKAKRGLQRQNVCRQNCVGQRGILYFA